MRVLVACEYSGTVRDAFIRRGHDAMSCDLLPTDAPGPHYVGDVRDVLAEGWDLMVAHPPCTYLTLSGVRWLHEDPERWDRMREAVEFFGLLWEAPIPRVAIENPLPHRHAGLPPYSDTVHPWQFGHPEQKRTCLWLRGLPPLIPTDVVTGRQQRIWKLPPTEDRWKIRSATFPGIAEAMAEQWGTTFIGRDR